MTAHSDKDSVSKTWRWNSRLPTRERGQSCGLHAKSGSGVRAGCCCCLPEGMELAGSSAFPGRAAGLTVKAGLWLAVSACLQNRGKTSSSGATRVLGKNQAGFRDAGALGDWIRRGASVPAGWRGLSLLLLLAQGKILSLLLTFATLVPIDLQQQPVTVLGVVTAAEGELALHRYLPLLSHSTSTL